MPITPGTLIDNTQATHPQADATTNAKAIRAAIGADPSQCVSITDYGAVSGENCDAAFAAAIAAAESAGHLSVYVPPGAYEISDAIAITASGTRVFGAGPHASAITQTENDKGAFVLPTGSPVANSVRISDLSIIGPGATVSSASAIACVAVGSTTTGEMELSNLTIQGFAKGVEARVVVKFLAENVSVYSCITGFDFDNAQTWICKDCRCVGLSDTLAGSHCYVIDGGTLGGQIIGGEYGGNFKVERFAHVKSGSLSAHGANLEGFTAAQIINVDAIADNHVSVTNCRLAEFNNSQVLISLKHTGDRTVGSAHLAGCRGFTGYHVVEIWSATSDLASIKQGPRITGDQAHVIYSSAQGSPQRALTNSPERPLSFDTLIQLPGYDSAREGASRNYIETTPTTDGPFVPTPVVKYTDARSGVINRWSGIANDQLSQVLATTSAIYTSATPPGETTIFAPEIPKGYLSQVGESVVLELWGTTSADTDNKRLRVYFQTAGTCQVETATVTLDGTAITTSGNATVIVTGALVVGAPTPATVSVPVVAGDTDAMVARKIREKLALTSAVSTHYIVGGTGTAVSLTRKNTVAGVDATMNIAIADGTGEGACDGITPADTSADTTAGVAKSLTGPFDTGALAANAEQWFLRVLVQRATTDPELRAFIDLSSTGTTAHFNKKLAYTIAHTPATAPLAISISGNAATGDLVAIAGRMIWHRAPTAMSGL
jgi:hypothetical protein